MIDLCKANGPQFADKLLDYQDVDEKTLMCFYDMSMPAISYCTYKTRILFNAFSSVVTESEEALAYLVFENNFNRWIYLAEEKVQECQSNQDGENSQSRRVPRAIYQAEVKQRKDNVDTVGKWTDEGLARFNELIIAVNRVRQSRHAFEELITRTYLVNEPNTSEQIVEQKRKLDKSESGKKKCVSVINTLNTAQL